MRRNNKRSSYCGDGLDRFGMESSGQIKPKPRPDWSLFSKTLDSLSTDVFEPRTATGSGAFSSLARIGDFLFINSSCGC